MSGHGETGPGDRPAPSRGGPSRDAPVSDGILVLNAGSSSLKFSLFRGGQGQAGLSLALRGTVEGLDAHPRFVVAEANGRRVVDEVGPTSPRGTVDHEAALSMLLGWIRGHVGEIALHAVGHRVVHGGERFTAPVRLDSAVVEALDALVPLAPLHQPHNLAAIRALMRLDSALPQVACFDTAFHVAQPWVARTFALPRALTESGLVRYGFHGLSYEFIAPLCHRSSASAPTAEWSSPTWGPARVLCAMHRRQSVATTMAFTPLDGLPMGTRCGALDPGVVLYLMDARGMTASQVADLLYHQSGLLGVSGLSSDMRDLLASDAPTAAQAIELFVYRIGRELGSLAAALGGLDVLIFTAGIGEHAAPIRAAVCRQAEWLGVRLDESANERSGPRISSSESPVSVWVVPDEEVMIARHIASLLNQRTGAVPPSKRGRE
jgi:acetate kinase